MRQWTFANLSRLRQSNVKKGVKRAQTKFRERQKPRKIAGFWIGICNYEIGYCGPPKRGQKYII